MLDSFGTQDGTMFKPLGNRVLVKPEAPEEKTTGGILIPGNVSNNPTTQGTVVALGPGHRNAKGLVTPSDLSLGDLVVWPGRSGLDVEVEGTLHVLLDADGILGVLD